MSGEYEMTEGGILIPKPSEPEQQSSEGVGWYVRILPGIKWKGEDGGGGLDGDMADLEWCFPAEGVVWGRLNLDDVTQQFLTDQHLRIFAQDLIRTDTPPPSLQFEWRKWADQRAQGDTRVSDNLFDERERQWRSTQISIQNQFIYRMQDRRTFMNVFGQVGFQMVPIPKRSNAITVHLVASIHVN